MDPARKPDYKQRLLELVPNTGESIGNAALRHEFRKVLAAAGDEVTDDDYWLIRDSLIEDGLIQTGKGRGGSVHRVLLEKEVAAPAPAPAEEVEGGEAGLYVPFHNAIRTGYAPANGIRRFVSEITAKQGRRLTGGRWTRPDVTLLAMRSYTFTPGKRLEVITFEVKPDLETALEGVFEALAHSVFAHRSYLAVHIPGYQNLNDYPDDRIYHECERFGVGYILFDDPNNYDTYDVVVTARLKEPDPAEVDNFIRTQVNAQNQEEVREWIR